MSPADNRGESSRQAPLDAFRRGSTGGLFRSRALERALKEMGGAAAEHGRRITRVLVERGEAKSEEIAAELEVKQKHVRNALERLYESEVVSRRRVEDSETGWISYRWRLDPERFLRRVRREKRKLLRETKEELRRERDSLFFACEDGCSRVDYGRAMELDFECPECGGKLHGSDSAPVVRDLEQRIERLERELEPDQNPGEGD